jgi:hypothetical protein
MFTGLKKLFVCGALAAGAFSGFGQLECEPWAATDGLGRELPGYKECGRPKRDKFVGVFYFLWLGGHEEAGPHDITQIMQQPEGERQWGQKNIFHWWGEPRFGYYRMDDEWVIAKHAQMLADAGIDVVIFDVTNGFTYKDHYLKLCKVFTEIRARGGKTPQVSFLFNSKHVETTRQVFDDFYRPGLYKDLWFEWQDKPLLMTNPEELPEEILDFFTIRRSWAWTKGQKWFGDGEDKWPWIDKTPQAFGWHDDDDEPEYVPVAAASHPVNSIGRSHKKGFQPPPAGQDATLGTYFQEQWDRALELDPEFIFITGWNEWVAQRFIYDGKKPRNFADGTINPGDTWFIDQFSIEYSRDCEPMRGGFEDNYYYQMVANVRKFKGVEKWCSWRDDIGDTRHRNHPGYAAAGPYVNNWGRNDIVACSVSKEGTNLIFSAETAEPLTADIDSTWMNLLIRNPDSDDRGWEGFQFRMRPESRTVAAFEQWVSNHWKQAEPAPDNFSNGWKKIASVPIKLTQKKITVSVPRKSIGEKFRTLEIKWFDHMPEPLDVLDFQDHGDTAPNNRFRYVVDL